MALNIEFNEEQTVSIQRLAKKLGVNEAKVISKAFAILQTIIEFEPA